ncbi:hypothetical protein BH20ACI4_BH20ACI4_16930 [soil metagenome]
MRFLILTRDNGLEKNTTLAGVLRDFRFGETLPRLFASRQEARNISNLADKNKADIRTDFQANVGNIADTNFVRKKTTNSKRCMKSG